ncbi:hypothetical protein [Micromonospora lupini]|uniref:Serpin domain-containing protein n=1 Tax=Micromonospora lupini str. Lupac 08 TaxID=1150864 RepID=I0L2Q5_9ACTN|nr:hypothetical protein [Micromonospora lupini]CCH18102.1 conserved hypothetical protein [Micromonospora lupini str. Lupac 08]
MTTDLHGPLAAYAERLHATIGDRHHVASPLGAWLLLALSAATADADQVTRPKTGTDPTEATDLAAATGPKTANDLAAATGPETGTGRLADALGTDLARAAEVARTLLDAPHPLVASATALWLRPGRRTDEPAGWRAALPTATEVGALPDQAGLDAWAREHTDGLIETFPLKVHPDVVFALASALATRISWAQPFEVTDARALGPASVWARDLRRALRSPDHGHQGAIVTTDRAGDVIVHAARAQATDGAGLVVLSVAAAPHVPPADVLAVAYDLSAGAAEGAQPAGRRSLFDLPLGDTALWTLREERVRTRARDGREERHSAVLPCWSARSEHDLTAESLGFPAATAALAGALDQPVQGFEARQVAMARYGRYGFEAAAVTGMFGTVSLPPEGVARTAELRFGHPYAVVAVATDTRADGVTGPWHGVPVFSAWVTEPDDLPDADA